MKKTKKSIIFILMVTLLILPTTVTAEDTSNDEKIYVTLGGEPFGIKMYTDGIYVLKTEGFINESGNICCPAEEAGIKCNDVIKEANGIKINENSDLKKIIEESKGNEIKLKVTRGEEEIYIKLKPILSAEGFYKTGMWIKDSAAGLGTISFYSEELGGFCGLGHGMCDNETQELIPITNGEANFAYVTSVTKSSNGNVGTLNGYFTDKEIGTFSINNNIGIYGELSDNIDKNEQIQIASKEEVVRGNAQIYTTINGQTPRYYDVTIVLTNKINDSVNMIIKVTDEDLINETGGVVQGMSGSPIIQNDKLVGTLTHVLVNNVDYGYGIYAETMYEQLKEVC